LVDEQQLFVSEEKEDVSSGRAKDLSQSELCDVFWSELFRHVCPAPNFPRLLFGKASLLIGLFQSQKRETALGWLACLVVFRRDEGD